MEEIRSNAAQAKHLFFCDDNFAANPTRAKDLLKRMKEEGHHPEWSNPGASRIGFRFGISGNC